MDSKGNISDQERQELLVLYQACVQDLAEFKSQQWALTNYTLVAFGSIFAVSKSAVGSACTIFLVNFVLCLVATALFALAVRVLWHLKKSIDKNRHRLKKIRNKFSDVFKEILKTKNKVSSGEMLFFLISILTVGLVFLWWLLCVIPLIASLQMA